VGPFAIGGYADTVMSVTSRSGVDIGASFRMIVDVAEWDRSVATMAPGQAERPEQPHFSDLAAPWAKGFGAVFGSGDSGQLRMDRDLGTAVTRT
jgi:penicillin amidase